MGGRQEDCCYRDVVLNIVTGCLHKFLKDEHSFLNPVDLNEVLFVLVSQEGRIIQQPSDI